jgi:hypothetical protein
LLLYLVRVAFTSIHDLFLSLMLGRMCFFFLLPIKEVFGNVPIIIVKEVII